MTNLDGCPQGILKTHFDSASCPARPAVPKHGFNRVAMRTAVVGRKCRVQHWKASGLEGCYRYDKPGRGSTTAPMPRSSRGFTEVSARRGNGGDYRAAEPQRCICVDPTGYEARSRFTDNVRDSVKPAYLYEEKMAKAEMLEWEWGFRPWKLFSGCYCYRLSSPKHEAAIRRSVQDCLLVLRARPRHAGRTVVIANVAP